jgi:hypothetical protein
MSQSAGTPCVIPATGRLSGETFGTVGVADVGTGVVDRLVGLATLVGVCLDCFGNVGDVRVDRGPTPSTPVGAMAVALDAGVGSTDSHPDFGSTNTCGHV